MEQKKFEFNMAQIGRRISGLRKDQNMTQMELADKLGISFQAVSNWERGNSMPDIMLQSPPAWFFIFPGWKKRQQNKM